MRPNFLDSDSYTPDQIAAMCNAIESTITNPSDLPGARRVLNAIRLWLGDSPKEYEQSNVIEQAVLRRIDCVPILPGG